jgi:uncharacterized protein (TIGR04141 family)
MQEDVVIRSIEDLRQLSRQALQSYIKTRYQEEYAWIDRSVPEDDDGAIERVLEAVWNGHTADGDAVPVDIVWGDQVRDTDDDGPVDHFRFRKEYRRSTNDTRKTLTWPGVRGHLQTLIKDGELLTELFQEPLRFFDDQDTELGSCSVLDLLTAELSLHGVSYVLADGVVWRVQSEFRDAVNEDLRSYVVKSDFPVYSGGSEDGYIKLFPSHSSAVLHKCLIRLPREGHYPVEPCDVIRSDYSLVHVKLKGPSATLNHLCGQAVASARLLRWVPAAREQVQELIIDQCQDSELTARLVDRVDDLGKRDHGWTVVFAIVGSWTIPSVSALPLMGRIALREACQRLDDLGFDPKIVLVQSMADKIDG